MARIVIGLSTFAGSVSRRLCLPLATICITACCDRPSGLSDAEKPVLDRIRQVRELRVAAAEYWPGVDAPHYDTPLLYLTDSVCYAVNPTPRLREEYGTRPVYRDADIAIYKTVLPDSLPFHMEVQYDFGQPEDGTQLIPTLFCSSPEITRTFEPDVTDDALWLPMVIHEYAHGFQFRQPGFAGAFRTSVAHVPEMELAALHKQHDWLDRAVREENTALLEALETGDDKVRDSCIVRFKGLRRARKQRMATILGGQHRTFGGGIRTDGRHGPLYRNAGGHPARKLHRRRRLAAGHGSSGLFFRHGLQPDPSFGSVRRR